MREILKEIAPGVSTHAYWVDDDGNVITEESQVVETIEEKLKRIQEDQLIIMEALADMGGAL